MHCFSVLIWSAPLVLFVSFVMKFHVHLYFIFFLGQGQQPMTMSNGDVRSVDSTHSTQPTDRLVNSITQDDLTTVIRKKRCRIGDQLPSLPTDSVKNHIRVGSATSLPVLARKVRSKALHAS